MSIEVFNRVRLLEERLADAEKRLLLLQQAFDNAALTSNPRTQAREERPRTLSLTKKADSSHA